MFAIKNLFIVIFTCFVSSACFSQTELLRDKELSLNNSTVENQFEYILKTSGNFKGTNGQAYEAVKLKTFLTLKANTIDSLKTVHKNLVETQAVVKKQETEILNLKKNLADTKLNLENTNIEKNNMALFGLQMSKSNYNILMWSIIGGLLALLLLFIFKFKNSNAVTKKANADLSEIEEEFEEHRKTALEREQKVRRQLQDEINKQKKV